MPVVTGFPVDVFVSYAHVDNVRISDEMQGWITDFVELLRSGLVRKAGRSDRINIWHDPALRSNDVFDDRIGEAISNSAVFLAVLSSGYLASSYCTEQELDHFGRSATARLPVEVKGKSRVSAVLIDDVSRDRWPASLKRSDGVRFTETNQNTGRLRLLRRPGSFDRERAFWDNMDKVVEDTWELLQAMANAVPDDAAAPTAQASVFLAEVTDDLQEAREQVRRELEQKGVLVNSIGDHAGSPEEVRIAISQALSVSALSIHLLGPLAGRAMNGTGVPLSELQCQIAGHETRLRPYPLFWISPDVDVSKVSNAQHRQFLSGLLQGERPNPIKVLRTDLEDLKLEILSRLPLPASAAKPVVRSRDKKQTSVYISFCNQAEGFTQALVDYLEKQNCAISLLNHSTPAARQRHKRWLRLCDGLLIMYEAQTKSWAEDTMLEARELSRERERPKKLAVVEVSPRSGQPFNVRATNIISLSLANGDISGAENFLDALDE